MFLIMRKFIFELGYQFLLIRGLQRKFYVKDIKITRNSKIQ
ncbi:MAG: hypothetical protein WHT65_00080 [Pseudothermotoga sp.]